MAGQEYEVYIGYLDGKEDEIDVGNPILVELRDLSTFERKVVRAVVAQSPETLQDGDKLWVMDWVEKRQPEPWWIKIVEEMDEDVDVIHSRSDIEDEDLTRLANESKKFSTQKHAGDGLAIPEGEEEAQKYLTYVTKMAKGSSPGKK